MFSLFYAGRCAAAVLAFVALFTAGEASAQMSGRAELTFSVAPEIGEPAGNNIALSSTPALQAQPAFGVQPILPSTAPEPGDPPYAPAQRSLQDLVAAFVDPGNQDAEQLCLAKAVYFEARGESLEGQLAVAEVVLNRAASGRYPSNICGVVTQPAQFSFIRRGRFPAVTGGNAWLTALAIADIARNRLANQIPTNVLWYHASYVSPAWGRRLTRVVRIGAHIFYG